MRTLHPVACMVCASGTVKPHSEPGHHASHCTQVLGEASDGGVDAGRRRSSVGPGGGGGDQGAGDDEEDEEDPVGTLASAVLQRSRVLLRERDAIRQRIQAALHKFDQRPPPPLGGAAAAPSLRAGPASGATLGGASLAAAQLLGSPRARAAPASSPAASPREVALTGAGLAAAAVRGTLSPVRRGEAASSMAAYGSARSAPWRDRLVSLSLGLRSTLTVVRAGDVVAEGRVAVGLRSMRLCCCDTPI